MIVAVLIFLIASDTARLSCLLKAFACFPVELLLLNSNYCKHFPRFAGYLLTLFTTTLIIFKCLLRFAVKFIKNPPQPHVGLLIKIIYNDSIE